MNGRPTDHANRDLAELHRQVIRGTSGGQIIWQPRILSWISDKQFERKPLPPPFTDLDPPGLYRELGVSNRIYEYNVCLRQVEDPRVHVRHERLNATDTLWTLETPVGTMTNLDRSTTTNRGTLRVKRWIETEGDLKVATWRAERTTWEWDQARYDELQQVWGTIGLPTCFMPRETVQDLYINTMGVERAIYALCDWPQTVEGYFQALNDCHERLVDVIIDCPIEVINFGDNLHGKTLSPDLFRRYVLPCYQQRGGRLRAAGKFVHAHWDGEVKSLLPFARETGLSGIEALTPAPQGDVTLEEMREEVGDEMFILDGIPAIYFDAMWPVEVLEECTRRVIELFAPRLILGISDELSAHGEIERVRLVTAIVDDYNASCGRARE